MTVRVVLTGNPAIVRDPGGAPVEDLGVGRLGRMAFAYLVFNHHRPVRRDELAAALWGEEPPRTWDTSLRVVVSRLRTWLARAGLDRSGVLTAADGCYRLDLPPDVEIDVVQAAADLTSARTALAGGDPRAAIAPARAASETTGRELLPGASGLWVEQQQEVWRELRLGALEAQAEALLLAGDPAAAVDCAGKATALEPLREPAHVLAMRALAAGGRRAEALRAYERLRRLLADELGASPSPRSEQCYLEILQAGDGGEDGGGLRPGPAPAPASSPAGLPADLSSFVGRQADVEGVAGRLRSARLVTLVGTGGLGKTRLAVEAARQLGSGFEGGVAFVPLGEVPAAGDVAAAALRSVGLAERPGRSPVESLSEGIGGRHLLLLLDNCEHVVEAAAALVAALIAACPQLVVLATSREALRIPGEAVWPVGPLSPDDARRLFLERAEAAAPAFGLEGGEREVLTALCERLDGIPLAIELAAARTAVLSLPEIVARLDDRFGLLTGGARSGPVRHQTLRQAVDWSYEALPERDRRLFGLLSVFAGGFSLDAAVRVCGGPEASVLDGLTSLVSRSLVLAAPAAGGATRYRMLETIRTYASERLAEAGNRDAAGDALVAWAADLAEQAEVGLDGPDQRVWLDRLEAEHPNLVAGLAAGGTNCDRLRAAAALGRFWEMRGHLHQGRDWLRVVLSETADCPPLLRARGENAAALLAQRQGDYAAARSRLEQSLALRRDSGDRLAVAATLHGLGNLAALRHDLDEAGRLFDESLAVGEELADASLVAASLENLGWVAHARGDFEAARDRYGRSLALHRDRSDRHGTARVLGRLGDLAYQQGDYEAAETMHRESLEGFTALSDEAGRADSLAILGHLAMHDHAGGLREARALLDESLAIRRRLGDRAALGGALINLADLALLSGDPAAARDHLEEAAAVATGRRDRAGLAHVLVHRGRLALVEGKLAEAAALLVESGKTDGPARPGPVTAEWLEAAAVTLAAAPAPELAARLLGVAGAMREEAGTPVAPYEHAAHELTVASVREMLGGKDFPAAAAGGDPHPLQAAIEEATLALARIASGD